MHDRDNDSRLRTDSQLSRHLQELKAAELAGHNRDNRTKGEDQGVIFKLNRQFEPIQYDTAELQEFLETVFHVELLDDEHILCYHDYGQHNLAISENNLFDILERSKKPARLYVGTATCYQDPDGFLRNKLGNFARYHMLVLDDIGVKVPIEKITLQPTYIIESSPGNFQYGYVLKEPLESLEEAQALVDLVYSAGLSDEGGKLATKKVRLPGGINGKRNKNFGFRSRLHHLAPTYFTPQEIITGLGINIDWIDVVNDAVEVRRRLKVAGASHWSPTPLMMPSNAGIVDTVAEWLLERHEVKNISGDWLEIECPWCDSHTDLNQRSAYYSPVGLGEGAHQQKRAFYCHHSHPETTSDFLQWVAAEGGPEAPVHDPSAELVASHIYDAVNETVYDIKASVGPVAYGSLKAFQQAHCKRLMIKGYNPTTGGLRFKTTTAHEMWSQHPARVIVRGTTYDPSTSARIVLENNLLKLNQYCMPDYGTGPFDQETVDTFLDYLEYLIPTTSERELFIDWLAAKFQNMAFRGWGMLMVAPQQRTGRGTLITMLSSLFFENNCVQISMNRLLDSTDNFNEWEARALVFVGESEAMSFHGHKFYSAYNRLKDIVDTTVRQAEINTKYGRKEVRNVYTSFLMCANETLALTLDRADQRFFVIQNNPIPANLEYFTKIRSWMSQLDEHGRPAWCKHVARYLRRRRVNLALLNGPAPSSVAKQEILDASRSPLDIALDALFDALPGAFFPNTLPDQILVQGGFSNRLEIEARHASKIIRTEVLKRSTSIKRTVKVKNQTVRVRANLNKSHWPVVGRFKMGTDTTTDRREMRTQLEKIDYAQLKKIVDQELTTEGY